MDITGKALDLFFRRIPPERILRWIRKSVSSIDAEFNDTNLHELFMRFAESTLHGYSEDECDSLFSLLKENGPKHIKKPMLSQTDCIFSILLDFTDDALVMFNEEPRCRISQALQWREVYHILGQDTLICAYLANHDLTRRTERTEFMWPATIRTDNGVLQQMLQNGIAENHRHLNGSAQAFDLSWCVLMNKPEITPKLDEAFRQQLLPVMSRGADDNLIPTAQRVQLAALIRSILFRALHRDAFSNMPADDGSGSQGAPSPFQSHRAFVSEYIAVFSPLRKLIDTVSSLRKSYGANVPLLTGETACLDYALDRRMFCRTQDSHYRVMVGERHFLYCCYSACFRGMFTEFEQLLFYLYLILKTAFRAEMIQQNQQVGFQNFANYETRKDMLWDSQPHLWEAYRMSLNAPLQTQAVSSLESRITPAKTVQATIKKVRCFDLGKAYADLPCPGLDWWSKVPFRPDIEPEKYLREPYFYVMHFVKRKDQPQQTATDFVMRCRHKALRDDIKKQAMALARALSVSPYLCNRIRGIDACNNEVICRPEVFATAFRFLKKFRTDDFSSASELLTPPEKYLSLTYHVGEDFYDIADGLRAIDETIHFLDLRRGDRLGHALALGVNPERHYRTKDNSIILPKQNRLDNLVWLLYRARELNLSINPQQYELLKQEAHRLMMEIYGSAIAQHHWSITLDEYYYSMMLRGDSPERYQTMRFSDDPSFDADPYERYALRPSPDQRLDAYRRDEKIAGLYYYYQFGKKEKEKGEKTVHVRITPEYMRVVEDAQEVLQKYVERRGFIVECNPTSNVLIGTFGQYASHPIFRLNNTGLTASEVQHQSSPQIQVCVNTDDLGIFDTSLEFEYALLFQALNEQRNEDGSKKYKSTDIIRYLQNVREMGTRAVFPTPRHIEC